MTYTKSGDTVTLLLTTEESIAVDFLNIKDMEDLFKTFIKGRIEAVRKSLEDKILLADYASKTIAQLKTIADSKK